MSTQKQFSTHRSQHASRGDWVQIHQVLLPPGQRAPQNPDDTRQVPLEMRLKGFLITDRAVPGETVEIETLSGRRVQGILVAIKPRYVHDFGDSQPALLTIGRELRQILKEGDRSLG